ncbi:histidine phosphatase family protein [Aquincola sp. S2]|uniref:Histidine phosphatase family protein n=1 Tax=Pseudaquabacterium terrae TaxID=2732868 RepID=A0ABX2E971_9BURK|nr:histidine phosphatase family protein [Aquabacterium terrae]NRF65499.1 histidine phosphatase family protein [Aquabacterium terrae]
MTAPHSRIVALAAAALITTTAAAEPSLVILVRHADKAAEPAGDVALSPAGEQRAALLAKALESAGVSAIITTHYRRTQQTARPLARLLGIEPQVIAVRRGEGAAHVVEVVQAVRAKGGTVLVVGHGDTVPAIIAALGGPALPSLCETSYGHAFVLTLAAARSPLVRFRYGEADPPAADGCL